jgi:hypothetical protein
MLVVVDSRRESNLEGEGGNSNFQPRSGCIIPVCIPYRDGFSVTPSWYNNGSPAGIGY